MSDLGPCSMRSLDRDPEADSDPSGEPCPVPASEFVEVGRGPTMAYCTLHAAEVRKAIGK